MILEDASSRVVHLASKVGTFGQFPLILKRIEVARDDLIFIFHFGSALAQWNSNKAGRCTA